MDNKIKYSKSFFKIVEADSPNQSALFRCLQFNGTDENLFKSWIAKEQNLEPNNEVVKERLNLILTLKEKLKSLESAVERNKSIKYLVRLISATFSGKKQSNLAISLALDKIIYAFKNKKPIVFIFGFGGYKNYNSPSFPEVDFAELFHLKFLVSYLFPIIKDYEYGVEIEYESEEISIQFNNIPQTTTDKYTTSFKKLIEYFTNNFEEVNNIKLNIKSLMARDMYKPQDLYDKMKIYYPSMKKIYDELSEEEKDVWYKRAKTNFLINGETDYSNLSDIELADKIVNARINNECFLAADYDLRVNYWERPNAISLFGTWGKTPCASPTDAGLHLKSTHASNTDFWIGTGIFKISKSKIYEEILSVTQYEKIRNILQSESNNDIDLKKISKNFNKVLYYQE